jgi:hypothetical protein
MIQVGKLYEVTHSRKGQFALRVTEVTGGWVTGIVHRGHLLAAMKAGVGQEVVILESLAEWKELATEEASL